MSPLGSVPSCGGAGGKQLGGARGVAQENARVVFGVTEARVPLPRLSSRFRRVSLDVDVLPAHRGDSLNAI